MNFTSLTFLCFFPVVYLVYWRLPHRFRWIWLLAAGYFFYMNWKPEAGLLLFGTTVITWLCAKLAAPDSGYGKKCRAFCKAVGILVPLLTLGIFKYADFFLESASELLSLTGRAAAFQPLSLLLPVGISFYTFQTLSYVIDVADGKTQAEAHFGYYALYVSFFPQLVAGPIEKPDHLLPQLKREAVRNRAAAESGFGRMLMGFFKKLLLADLLAFYADPVFADPSSACGPTVILAVFFFTLQIYFDFSGYSDIACGAAEMLGIELMENFDHPYRAGSVHEFWRRWHISLTKWLTEYVYIPLGGSRKGKRRTAVNIMLVFLASGLWHGAGWHYVLWGGLHGIYMLAEMLPEVRKDKPEEGISGKQKGIPEEGISGKQKGMPAEGISGKQKGIPEEGISGKQKGMQAGRKSDITGEGFRRARTFLLVMAAWMVFRAQSLRDAGILIRQLFCGWGGSLFTAIHSGMGLDAAGILQITLGMVCLRLMEKKKGMAPEQKFFLTLAIAAGWIWLLSQGAESAFLYFQF